MNASQEYQQWQNAPVGQKHYQDGPEDGNEAAERAYRSAFRSAVRLAVTSNPQALEKLFNLSEQQRTRARRESEIGSHVLRYKPGHAIEASRTRGYSHGLHAVLQALRCGVPQIDMQAWGIDVESWSNGDCTELIPPPDAPRGFLVCPSCKSDRTRHEQDSRHQCNRCGWRFILNADGSTRDFISLSTAGRRKRGPRK